MARNVVTYILMSMKVYFEQAVNTLDQIILHFEIECTNQTYVHGLFGIADNYLEINSNPYGAIGLFLQLFYLMS